MKPAFPRPAVRLAALLSTILLAGCQRHNDHGHPHETKGGHEHEEKTAQISVWTDRHKVFAEHKAPVAGKPMTFITHVTDLLTLEPRREGPEKLVLDAIPSCSGCERVTRPAAWREQRQ